MADVKITALTAISSNPVNPATFPIPMVDLLDNTITASGTTKKVTVNQILGAGGTATLASATITGAATVGTTLGVTGVSTLTGNVGVGVAPTLGLNVLKPSDTSFINLPINVAIADSTAMAAGVGGGIAFGGRVDGTANTTAFGIISGVKENGTAANYASALVFGTRDAGGNVNIERLRINSTGNIVMKNANTGIDFSINSNATGATSEILNDYEEGTWTIGLQFGGASTLMTKTSDAGKYTKIGNQVTVTGYLGLSNKGSATGVANITGLPFAIGNSNANYTAVSLYLNVVTFADYPMGYGNINTTNIVLQEATNAGVRSNLTEADFSNNSEIVFTMTYTV